ncbi:hypothetical protein NDU88_011400 [Pleurodeles waltl]|uniref:Uncharacterized protein n=1 Tax=Pleurodeles waltl TaxID=8319 RepID=A0AAV7R2X7_PLEWA|nr:hypothetical protein NDU88_011400 [Pleurodeles waltl]
MGQCPRGTFPNPEARSQDDDSDVRKDWEKREEAARPEGGKSLTETGEDAEPSGRGAEMARRKTALGKEPPQRALQCHNASHILGGTWLSQQLLILIVAGWRTSRLHSALVPDRNGASEVLQRTKLLKSGIRIPRNIPIEGRRAQSAEEGEAAGAGNPDIRVPESLKSKEGLRAGCTEREKDAERRAAESAEKEDSGEDERTIDPYLGEGGPFNARDNPTEGQDGPKKPELRHVPGWTWLKQVLSCLRDKLRCMVGREEGGGDE